MSEKHGGKLKIVVVFGMLFIVVSILLLLVFYAGKKTYVVTFDLNGGTLIGGSVEQYITQGQDASPPTVVKDGAYLHSWRGSYKQITKNTVIEAVWEYPTTAGIKYADSKDQNYTEIIGAYEYLRGEVYLGAYFGDKKILGIAENAFANQRGLTKIYLIDGLLSIDDGAFKNCSGITEIEIPETVTHIGKEAFKGCRSLEKLVLHEGLLEIESGAFEGCINLKEIVLPDSVLKINSGAFDGCDNLTIIANTKREIGKSFFAREWYGSATVVWPEEEETTAEDGTTSETETDGE
jgi:hypothetical protein